MICFAGFEEFRNKSMLFNQLPTELIDHIHESDVLVEFGDVAFAKFCEKSKKQSFIGDGTGPVCCDFGNLIVVVDV